MSSQPPGRPCSLRLGTRGSQLARWQAEWVAGELRKLGHAVELVEIATHGDVERTRPIEEIGTRGVFTKAIQQALLANEVDLAVHSLKDLPTEPVEGLALAAVSKRESPADVLICRTDNPVRPVGRAEGTDKIVHPTDALAMLQRAARVGTGSLRRQAQLLHWRPDLRVSEVRGNVDTRLRKLDEGQFDAIVLAEAGLRRLGLADRIQHVLPFDVMLPAVGQGALGIECRDDDDKTLETVEALVDLETFVAVMAERELLSRLHGGCMAPIAALGQVESGKLRLQAVVLSTDGVHRLEASESGSASEPNVLGKSVAQALLKQGAAELIAGVRSRGLE